MVVRGEVREGLGHAEGVVGPGVDDRRPGDAAGPGPDPPAEPAAHYVQDREAALHLAASSLPIDMPFAAAAAAHSRALRSGYAASSRFLHLYVYARPATVG